MRAISLILIACILPLSGCASYIARSGFEVGSLWTRQQVHAEFGRPRRTETVDGGLVEHYQTRRKLSEPRRAVALGTPWMGLVGGLYETVLFPYELYLLGRRSLLGQDFRVHYDSNGNITRLFLEANGDFLLDGEGDTRRPVDTESERVVYTEDPYESDGRIIQLIVPKEEGTFLRPWTATPPPNSGLTTH